MWTGDYLQKRTGKERDGNVKLFTCRPVWSPNPGENSRYIQRYVPRRRYGRDSRDSLAHPGIRSEPYASALRTPAKGANPPASMVQSPNLDPSMSAGGSTRTATRSVLQNH